MRLEPAYGIYIPPSDNMTDCPTLLIAHTRNRKVSELAHQRLDIDPILVKMATQALGIVMEDSDILHRTDECIFPKISLTSNPQSSIEVPTFKNSH